MREALLTRGINRLIDLLYRFRAKRSAPKLRVEGACRKTGNCCRALILGFRGKPITDHAQFKKLLKEKPHYTMFTPRDHVSDDGYLRFSCKNLKEDHTCGIYETRPDICRNYPDPRMIALGGSLLPGCGYRIVPEESFEEMVSGPSSSPDK